VDQQATRTPQIQSGASIYPGYLKGSQGVTPFLKVTARGFRILTYNQLAFGIILSFSFFCQKFSDKLSTPEAEKRCRRRIFKYLCFIK
jgi:hypothetical protein